MSRTLRRLYSSFHQTPSPQSPAAPSRTHSSAAAIASQFLSDHGSKPSQTRQQTLDLNQLQLLQHTLGHAPPTSSTATIPPCHHLAYFSPHFPASSLGADGTDTSYNPSSPFTRRMWAGGQLTWSQGNRLRVGDTVTESTKVLSADAKVTKAGEQMIVVRVEKEFSNETGVALTDERNWVFRPAVEEGLTLAVKERAEEVPFRELGEGETAREYTQSHVDLFRFSAVTFNAHKIHYNREWCRGVEGHRECVVHGPLNLILMVDLWRGVYGGKGEEVVPKRVSYRATNPVYAGDRYRVVVGKENEQKVAEVGVEDCFGNVNMKGLIERW